MGIIQLLDNPLFRIYVLGRAPVGELKRPFKKEVSPFAACAALQSPNPACCVSSCEAACCSCDSVTLNAYRNHILQAEGMPGGCMLPALGNAVLAGKLSHAEPAIFITSDMVGRYHMIASCITGKPSSHDWASNAGAMPNAKGIFINFACRLLGGGTPDPNAAADAPAEGAETEEATAPAEPVLNTVIEDEDEAPAGLTSRKKTGKTAK